MVPALLMVSVLIFVLSEVVPGDVGRTILGPYATPQQVRILDHQLGADKPIVERYASWMGRFVTGKWGTSQVLEVKVLPLVLTRLGRSLLLAGVAFVIVVPLSIALGVLAGVRENGMLDRVITISTLSLTVIPEFVSGAILLVLLAVAIHLFPVTATPPPGANVITRFYYLLLPAIPLMFILLGYIGRMARAGTVDTLAKPYIRSAVLEGLPRRHVIMRHVLPNAMVPTVTVIGAQVGWLVGGLVVVETLFSYPGLGSLMVQAAIGHDVLVLEASVLVFAFLYMLANLAADVVVAALSPSVRRGG
jgi:peptide/nickel transport system permease protein